MSNQVDKTDEWGYREVYSLNSEGGREGIYRWYYPNGQLRVECTYKNGKKDGLYSSWHENGQPWEECSYEDGKYEGLYQSFWSNGALREKCTYENGVQQGSFEARWYEGGISERFICKDGRVDGLYESFDQSGKKIKESVYCEGKELEGEEATEYLKNWKEKKAQDTKEHHAKIIDGMKERLAKACDVKKKEGAGAARTAERGEMARSAIIMRRKRDILTNTLQKVLAGGDGRILAEMRKTIGTERQDELQKLAYQRLSDDDKALISEIIQETSLTREVLGKKFAYFRMLVRNKKARRG